MGNRSFLSYFQPINSPNYVAFFPISADRQNCALFLHPKHGHILFWPNPTRHSKFHITVTPSACHWPQSDCWYSLAPASAGSPLLIPFPPFYPVPNRGTGEGWSLCPRQACATTAYSEWWALNSLTWPDLIGKRSPCSGGSGFPLGIWKVLYHMSWHYINCVECII